MSTVPRFKRGETAIPIKFRVLRPDGALANLASYDAVDIRMRRKKAPPSDAVSLEPTIVEDDDTHNLRHDWTTGELSEVGRFLLEVVITMPDGTIAKPPGDEIGLEIEIFDDVG